MADCLAVDRLVRLTGEEASAAALALEAGADTGLWDDCFLRLVEAVERGLVATMSLAPLLRASWRGGE